MIAALVRDAVRRRQRRSRRSSPPIVAERRDAKLEREIGPGIAARSDASSGDVTVFFSR
jgi:hypothetical protein